MKQRFAISSLRVNQQVMSGIVEFIRGGLELQLPPLHAVSPVMLIAYKICYQIFHDLLITNKFVCNKYARSYEKNNIASYSFY